MSTPQNTANRWQSQSVQIANLDSALADATATLSDSINAGLVEVMTNITTFTSFVSSGDFSGQTILSIPSDVNSPTLAFKTFVLSQALTANGLVAEVGPSELTSDQQFVAKQLCNWNGQNVCYENVSSNYTWVLSGGSIGSSRAAILGNALKYQWTDLSTLMQGAWNCAEAGYSGQGLINWKPDGSLDMSCMSQLQQCLVDSTGTCPMDLVGGECPVSQYTSSDWFRVPNAPQRWGRDGGSKSWGYYS